MTKCYSLSRHLDSAAAPPIAADLLGLRGTPIRVDGAEVAFVGALGLQVLISARRQWSEDGVGFSVHPISPALAKAACGLGIDPAEFGGTHDDTSNMEPPQ